MRIIQSVMEHIKIFFQNYANNASHTLSADIKEFFATYVLSIGYYILYIMPQHDELKRTKELKNTKKGTNCFVFANGPSINLLDIKKIGKYQKSGFDVICLNSYISSKMAKIVVPNYYLLSDPGSFGINKNINENTILRIKNEIDCLNKLGVPVFIPAQYCNVNIIESIYIFNDFENRFTGNIDPTKPRGYISMTAYKALAIACHLGYETIYVAGFDNDYFKSFSVDENNELYFEDNHFYDFGMKRKLSPNSGRGLGNLLWEHHLLFKHLELFSNKNIINLNKNSLVDAFSKKHDLDIYIDS